MHLNRCADGLSGHAFFKVCAERSLITVRIGECSSNGFSCRAFPSNFFPNDFFSVLSFGNAGDSNNHLIVIFGGFSLSKIKNGSFHRVLIIKVVYKAYDENGNIDYSIRLKFPFLSSTKTPVSSSAATVTRHSLFSKTLF
mgnify:CR=1 FL=1